VLIEVEAIEYMRIISKSFGDMGVINQYDSFSYWECFSKVHKSFFSLLLIMAA
jgi:hypothetical protein